MQTLIIESILILCLLGSIAGFLSGLLGVGGGIILVPGMYYILCHLGYPVHAMHVAVGTSLLTILFTNSVSALAHYRRGTLDLSLLRKFIPGIVIGVAMGTVLAGKSDNTTLKIIFASSQIIFGGYVLFNKRKDHIFDNLPRQPYFSCVAAANACLSTMMGIAGAVQNVIFMTVCNVDIRRAIAIAAAVGPIVAITGSIGFLIIGSGQPGLPPYSIGFINMAMFVCIVSTSIVCAPLGAKVSHRLSVPSLKRCFAIFMICIAINMIYETVTG